LVLTLVIGCLLAGCGGGSNKSDTGGVQLLLADDPIDAKAVNVTISQVAVSKDGEGWTVLKDFGDDPVTIDLLQYRYDGDNDTPDQYLLADTPLTEGHYTQIRLILTKVEVVDNSDVVHECEMSSQDQTGLKLVGEFDVAADAKTAVLIDFNVAKSIVVQGNGTYRLQPTVKVVPINLAGAIKGVVEFKDASDATVEVPQGATISAYQGETLAGTAMINADGSFKIVGLLAGSYTLKLETEGYTAEDATVAVTAGNDSDAGTITATPAQSE
jgi:hypothetical protein